MAASGSRMRLRVATPAGTVLDEPILALRAEDESGFFGIRPGHEPFLTCLTVGIVTYRRPDGSERYLAVRRGVLLVDADGVAVVTRDAASSADLADLEDRVVETFRRADEEERTSGAALTRMQIAALRQLMQYEDLARSASP